MVRLVYIALLAIFLFGLQVPQASAQQPPATIHLNVVKAGFIIGGSGGTGTLNFQGQIYPLTIGSLNVGFTIGVTAADIVGEVYNLNNPADIVGQYSAVGGGAAFVVGGSVKQMSNARGVVLHLRSKDVGLGFSLNMSGLTISLK